MTNNSNTTTSDKKRKASFEDPKYSYCHPSNPTSYYGSPSHQRYHQSPTNYDEKIYHYQSNPNYNLNLQSQTLFYPTTTPPTPTHITSTSNPQPTNLIDTPPQVQSTMLSGRSQNSSSPNSDFIYTTTTANSTTSPYTSSNIYQSNNSIQTSNQPPSSVSSHHQYLPFQYSQDAELFKIAQYPYFEPPMFYNYNPRIHPQSEIYNSNPPSAPPQSFNFQYFNPQAPTKYDQIFIKEESYIPSSPQIHDDLNSSSSYSPRFSPNSNSSSPLPTNTTSTTTTNSSKISNYFEQLAQHPNSYLSSSNQFSNNNTNVDLLPVPPTNSSNSLALTLLSSSSPSYMTCDNNPNDENEIEEHYKKLKSFQQPSLSTSLSSSLNSSLLQIHQFGNSNISQHPKDKLNSNTTNSNNNSSLIYLNNQQQSSNSSSPSSTTSSHSTPAQTSTNKSKSSSPYNRKEKSLGTLCDLFLSEYSNKPQHQLVLVDIAHHFKVDKRRIYEIINVMECISIVTKMGKNAYYWSGISKVHQYVHSIFHSNQNLFSSGPEFVCEKCKLKSESNLLTNKDVTKKQGEHAMVTIEDISKFIKAEKNCAKSKRLYDIANIFVSIKLIDRAEQPSSRKVFYSWRGPPSIESLRLSSCDYEFQQ
eukprot:gene2488-3080_t